MTPRLKMLAGPNGSGKTTLIAQLESDYSVNFYSFLNADMLLAEIAKSNRTACPFSIDPKDLTDFVKRSTYPDEYRKFFSDGSIVVDDEDYIVFTPRSINSYTVAIVADFLKEQFVERKISFSFETVFSHPSKIDLLKRAQDAEFRTYMYFIATGNPVINKNRIADRVSHGGHDVPDEKIYPRYRRCLDQKYKRRYDIWIALIFSTTPGKARSILRNTAGRTGLPSILIPSRNGSPDS